MACYKPLKGYRAPSGKITFDRKGSLGILAEAPCGQCLGCRLDYSQSWAIRCLHEASLFEENCFLTLTYDHAHMPLNGSINVRHFQLFMKKLRQHIRPKKIRFYQVGEYGEEGSRPHYHALIFNYDFPDKEVWSYGQNQSTLYRSPLLEKLWHHGYSTIGELNFTTAAYAARYSIKKIRGKASEQRDPDSDLLPYQWYSTVTGELHTRTPESATMSRRPGIGKQWYDKYKSDVFPDDFVVHNGRRVKTPKYYRDQLLKADPALHDHLSKIRAKRAKLHEADNTRARLDTRLKVKQAQINTLKRSYEDGSHNV